ncbi:hypothetical protein ACJX0J_035333, partial [Zea mays]
EDKVFWIMFYIYFEQMGLFLIKNTCQDKNFPLKDLDTIYDAFGLAPPKDITSLSGLMLGDLPHSSGFEAFLQ